MAARTGVMERNVFMFVRVCFGSVVNTCPGVRTGLPVATLLRRFRKKVSRDFLAPWPAKNSQKLTKGTKNSYFLFLCLLSTERSGEPA